jgi:hypothetical protein
MVNDFYNIIFINLIFINNIRVIIFDSVQFLLKKNNKKPKPVQTDEFRLGYFGKKPVQTGLTRFFLVWLVFFPVWVRFGVFDFRLIKPNRTGRF